MDYNSSFFVVNCLFIFILSCFPVSHDNNKRADYVPLLYFNANKKIQNNKDLSILMRLFDLARKISKQKQHSSIYLYSTITTLASSGP